MKFAWSPPPLRKSDGANVMVSHWTLRRGRFCSGPTVDNNLPSSLHTIKRNCFSVHGANLCNALPQRIRDLSGCNFEVIKYAIDDFLKDIPDEPHIDGHSSRFRAGGGILNSLICMINTC